VDKREKNVPDITLLPKSSTTFPVSENQRVIRLKANGGSKKRKFGSEQRFVSSIGNMEVFLSHTHSIVYVLVYFEPKKNFKNFKRISKKNYKIDCATF
jgi:hypothetical protein